MCGELRQIYVKIGACREISDSARLKTSCRALSASVRWTKTICRGAGVPQPMRNCHERHVSKRLFQHGGDLLGPKPKAVSRDKKSVSVRQADVPANVSTIDRDKKSAVL